MNKSEEKNKHTANKCKTHNRILEFMCSQCNLLLCSKCNNTHLQTNLGHRCDHIDDIRLYLSSVNLKDTNNLYDEQIIDSNINDESIELEYDEDISLNTDNSNTFEKEMNGIWTRIKVLAGQVKSLDANETDIRDHFREIHEFLQMEEFKLKTPITETRELIKEAVNNEINQLKSLLNIINFNSSISRDNSSCSPDSSFSSSQMEAYTTQQFTTDTIISSIQYSRSLEQFIHSSNNIIFQEKNTIIDGYKDNLNNDTDLIILELIKKHNNKYNSNLVQPKFDQYVVSTNEYISKMAKQNILKSISIDTITTDENYEPTIIPKSRSYLFKSVSSPHSYLFKSDYYENEEFE